MSSGRETVKRFGDTHTGVELFQIDNYNMYVQFIKKFHQVVGLQHGACFSSEYGLKQTTV